MTHMREMIDFSQQNGDVAPSEGLERFLEQVQMNQMMQMNGGMQSAFAATQPGMRTPSLGNQVNFFASPQNLNLQLPNNMNSPHMRPGQSPAMQASGSMMGMGPQPMVAQLSQQGSASATASSNTSPNVSSKKRRASAVKVEGDEANGAKANPKATPKGGSKRQKNAGS